MISFPKMNKSIGYVFSYDKLSVTIRCHTNIIYIYYLELVSVAVCVCELLMSGRFCLQQNRMSTFHRSKKSRMDARGKLLVYFLKAKVFYIQGRFVRPWITLIVDLVMLELFFRLQNGNDNFFLQFRKHSITRKSSNYVPLEL